MLCALVFPFSCLSWHFSFAFPFSFRFQQSSVLCAQLLWTLQKSFFFLVFETFRANSAFEVGALGCPELLLDLWMSVVCVASLVSTVDNVSFCPSGTEPVIAVFKVLQSLSSRVDLRRSSRSRSSGKGYLREVSQLLLLRKVAMWSDIDFEDGMLLYFIETSVVSAWKAVVTVLVSL